MDWPEVVVIVMGSLQAYDFGVATSPSVVSVGATVLKVSKSNLNQQMSSEHLLMVYDKVLVSPY